MERKRFTVANDSVSARHRSGAPRGEVRSAIARFAGIPAVVITAIATITLYGKDQAGNNVFWSRLISDQFRRLARSYVSIQGSMNMLNHAPPLHRDRHRGGRWSAWLLIG
jgi:hypothetical protein